MRIHIPKKWTTPIAVLLVLVFGFVIWQILSNNRTGTINLTVVPSDSQILIDGKTKASPGNIRLKPGVHSFKVSRSGFKSSDFTITITAKTAQSKELLLSSDNSTASQTWANANADDARQGEGIAGSDANTIGQNTTVNNPLIAKLPYTGSDFQIDFGASVKHPHDPNYVAIYVTPDSADGKQHALDWITAQGFDPNAYEIIYNQSYDN